MDRTELLKRSAEGEELTEEETKQLVDYMSVISDKMQLDPEAIYKYMWREVKKEDRRMSQPVRTEAKIGRNEICPCGLVFGAKYKKCCGRGK